MGFPGYYLSDPLEVQAFPVAPRYGSSPLDIQKTDLVIQTERMRSWIYPQARQAVPKLVFRASALDIEFFRTLDLTVDGQAIPFYFVPDIDDMSGAMYVRKEPHFRPRELDQPGVVQGVEMAFYDYVLELTEEPDGVEVLP